MSCPWSPKYPLAPSAPGASAASSRNPHRAQPCRPVAVPAGHCCGTDTVIRVHTWRCSFRTLSAAFAASFYLAMLLCTRLCAKVGTFGSLERPEAIPPVAGSQISSTSRSKTSSIPAGTEGKLGRVGADERPALCSFAAGNKLFALDLRVTIWLSPGSRLAVLAGDKLGLSQGGNCGLWAPWAVNSKWLVEHFSP